MEDFPENYFEARLKLSKGEELESGLCEKLFTVSLKNEDKNNFILKATDGEEEYILHLKYSDYINLVEREFSKICNNFQLLFKRLKSSFENKKVVICKTINYSLKMIFYCEKKALSFELFPKDYIPSEVIEHLQINDREYKVDLIKYDKKFEDYGDRFTIKCVIENVGTTTWDKKITSLVCLPEYSSLICNEFFFEEEVIPNEQVCIELEYLKNEKLNLNPPYFTFLYLAVKGVIFYPGLVLDFNDTFNESNDNKPNFNKKTEIRKILEKKMTKIPEKDKIKKIKTTAKKYINKIINETKDNNAKKKKSEEKTKLEEEIKDLKNANANLKKELEKQKKEVIKVQEENKQLKKEIKKLTEDNNKLQKEIEKKDDSKEKEYSYELLSKDLQKNAVQFETKEIDFELQIKNNGNLPWPEDGKAKLVVENKNGK